MSVSQTTANRNRIAAKPERRIAPQQHRRDQDARRHRASPAAHHSAPRLRRQRRDAEARRARSSATAMPDRPSASSSAAPTSAHGAGRQHGIAVVRADQRVPFPQHAERGDRPERDERPVRRNRPPPIASGASTSDDTMRSTRLLRPASDGSRVGLSSAGWMPVTIRSRSARSGRRTGARGGDIRRSRSSSAARSKSGQ